MDGSQHAAFARMDSVSLLPNRRQFVEDYARQRTARPKLFMVSLTDANHYDALLRALGHEYAEDFIRAGFRRIRQALPRGTEVYHVSVLSVAFFCRTDFTTQVVALLKSWSQPLRCGGIPIVTRLGIGVVDCIDPNPAVPLRSGLTAAQDSRRSTAGWAMYSPKADIVHRRSFMLLSDLPDALVSSDQMALVFQPKYDLATGKVSGAEALIRWAHPRFGDVPPSEFVPLAESTGLIADLTRWVQHRAILQAARWRAEGLKLNMALNVSPQNLSQPGFAEEFAALLKHHQVDPTTIELEFTEGTLASDDEVTMAELWRLRDLGMHIALDDFGTGFSNFSYITRLPADIIKIDRSLVQRISHDDRSAEVVRTVIELAHRLQYHVVAEGIETDDTYRSLASWNCDEGQGYLMSRPVSAAEFSVLIRSEGQQALC